MYGVRANARPRLLPRGESSRSPEIDPDSYVYKQQEGYIAIDSHQVSHRPAEYQPSQRAGASEELVTQAYGMFKLQIAATGTNYKCFHFFCWNI